MKRIYGLASALLLCVGAYAQSVTLTSDTLIINTAGGSGVINMTPAPNAVGAGVLTVYTRGDFSAPTSEYVDVIDEGATIIGQASSGVDCATTFGTDVFNVLQADINVWNANGMITFDIDAATGVNVCSPIAEIYATLTYDTCAGGTPAMVSYTASAYTMCADPDTATLTPNITGGTFSGAGVVGDVFYPALVGAGSYTITYTYFDAAVGCTSMFEDDLVVTNSLVVMDTTICMDGMATLTSPDGDSNYIWYDSNMLPIDTGAQITVGPLSATTNYYLSEASTEFSIDTIYTTGFSVDHNSITSDDRGGIAVTENYVYINGDGSIVRYDTNMTNPISLPQNDGIFSDLSTGQLYALFNTTSGYPVGSSLTNFSVDAIVSLDDMLVPIDTIALSQAFNVSGNYGGADQSGIYAGSGYVIVYTGTASTTFNRIDLPTGSVTDMGVFSFTTKQGNENWSHWGFSEIIGGDYSVVYRGNAGDQIDRLNLTSFASTTIQTFTNLSDMASITYSPWANRIYFHNESSNQWNTGSEMGGYIDAGHISGDLVVSGNCKAEATVTVDVCAGVDELTADLGVNVYPNPSNGELTIQLADNRAVKTTVFDVYGKVVFNQTLVNDTEYKLDLTNLSTGIYFLQLQDGENNTTKRLIIQ